MQLTKSLIQLIVLCSVAFGKIDSNDKSEVSLSLVASKTNLKGATLSSPKTNDNNLRVREEVERNKMHSQIRTATGGLINTLMIVLTIFAFIGNGLFLVYVFWLSK